MTHFLLFFGDYETNKNRDTFLLLKEVLLGISMPLSLTDIVKRLDGIYGVHRATRDDDIKLIRRQLRKGVGDEREMLDLFLLFKYLTGKKTIIDRETGKKRKIRKGKLEDLSLLSVANVKSEDEEGQFYNPELFKIRGRFDNRRQKNKRRLNYSQALERVFRDKEVIEYLGVRASYESYVHQNYQSSEREDIGLLTKYVIGKKPIVDKETGKERRIRKKVPEDLALLRRVNITFKKDGRFYNPEFFRLYSRFESRHLKNKMSLSYTQALSMVFMQEICERRFGKYIPLMRMWVLYLAG